MSNERRYQQRLSTFAANWRALALRGIVALLFGLVVLFWPGLVLTVLALLFGIYAAVDGAITFIPALRSPDRGVQRTLPLAEGAVGIIAGLVAILWPGLTTSGLVYVIDIHPNSGSYHRFVAQISDFQIEPYAPGSPLGCPTATGISTGS